VFVSGVRWDGMLRGRGEWQGSICIGAEGCVRLQEGMSREGAVTCGCLVDERQNNDQLL
jgi:hypothetical protein